MEVEGGDIKKSNWKEIIFFPFIVGIVILWVEYNFFQNNAPNSEAFPTTEFNIVEKTFGAIFLIIPNLPIVLLSIVTLFRLLEVLQGIVIGTLFSFVSPIIQIINFTKAKKGDKIDNYFDTIIEISDYGFRKGYSDEVKFLRSTTSLFLFLSLLSIFVIYLFSSVGFKPCQYTIFLCDYIFEALQSDMAMIFYKLFILIVIQAFIFLFGVFVYVIVGKSLVDLINNFRKSR